MGDLDDLGLAGETPVSLPTPRSRDDMPIFCEVTQDGRHPANTAIAAWRTPAGLMCNYHCSQGWPMMTAHRRPPSQFASPAQIAQEAGAITAYRQAYRLRAATFTAWEEARATEERRRGDLDQATATLEQARAALLEVLA